MKQLFNAGKRRWLVLFPLMGFAVLVILVKLKPAPKLKDNLLNSPLVSVEAAKVRTMQAVVSGYGRAQSKETWQAVSEVAGTVIYRHPDLEKGGMLPKGTVALKIDPVDYQLKLAQAKSDFSSATAEAKRIEFNKNKMQVSLDLEKSRLKILQSELKRKQGLAKKGSISRSAVDQEQSNVYAQQQKVVDLQTSLNLIPNDIEVAKAKISVNESRVKEAQRKLDKTEITVPFDARITSVTAELEQVINQQQVLIGANHIGAMEIPAQFSFTDMKQLIQQSMVGINLQQAGGFPDIRRLALEANIKLYSGEIVQVWPGKVTRVSDTIDVQGNTIELMVEMQNDWRSFDPINKPPVLNDMFVEVNIKAKQNQVLSVPAESVHGDKVYIAQGGVLKVKPVKVLFESDGFAAVDAEVKGTVGVGDLIIITDLLPAIEGMDVRTDVEQGQ